MSLVCCVNLNALNNQRFAINRKSNGKMSYEIFILGSSVYSMTTEKGDKYLETK